MTDNYNKFFAAQIQKDSFYELAAKIKFSENAEKCSVEQFMLKFFEIMNSHMQKPIPTFAHELMCNNTLHLSELKMNDGMANALKQFFQDAEYHD